MTEQFQFDTSGYVQCLAPDQKPNTTPGVFFWSDLSPGVQGCIAGMLGGQQGLPPRFQMGGKFAVVPYGFSDLHRDTLARIIADWERWDRLYPRACNGDKVKSGAQMWELRQVQHVHRPDFPPLTPYLNDEGKVCLRDAGVGGA